MLALRPEHDHAHGLVGVERCEDGGKLVPLRHAHDVERRPVEHDVGAGRRVIELYPETVEMGEGLCCGHALLPPQHASSFSYSPAISLRRSTLPTGDFGMARTKT